MSGIKLTMRLSYGPKREMTVACAPSRETCYVDQSRSIEQKPMIRIANRLLLESGFKVGSKIEVEYGHNIITITRKANEQMHGNYTHSPKQPHAIQDGSRFAVGEAGLLHQEDTAEAR